MKILALRLAGATVMLSACAEAPSSDDFGYNGTGIAVSVAPLTLESLSDACYSFVVVNGNDELVVGRGPGAVASQWGASVTGSAMNTVCASQFGNGDGGDVSYVAPCDADQAAHDVTLWVDALCDSAADPLLLNKAGDANWEAASPNNGSTICDEIQPYQNPCGSAGCTLPVTCVENADTPVTFNFTIMGQADQGFFDIAVNFDDVFCSAKLDTCNTQGEAIRLSFDSEGNRINSAVLAVACSAGPGSDVTTFLTHSLVEVACTNGGMSGDMNLASLDEEGNFDFTSQGGLSGAAYFGTESLPGVNKVYTNLVFPMPTGAQCTFTWAVVPSNGPFASPLSANTYSSFGYILFNGTRVQSPNNGGDVLPTNCTNLPLDGAAAGGVQINGNPPVDGSGVTTQYGVTSPNTSPDFFPQSELGEGQFDIELYGTNP
jgi:hypothetical protein